ncbi:MAG: type II toxin-antitoxin system YafQ family toxin [Bacteroidales bacterium]|nr:type II toxin-antitoxin system YafQ family toxin [Bacteroidales bacterium]
MYSIDYTGQFKKHYKLCVKRGLDVAKLKTVIELLAADGCLPAEYRPHILSGKYAGIWECHISSDWLLLWKQNDNQLQLLMVDTGTHSDIFG